MEKALSDFRLHYKQRAALRHWVTQPHDARLVVRAYAQLWYDEGVAAEEIAQRLQTSRQSVYNWIQRFQRRQGLPLEFRWADAARCGRPAILKGGWIEPLVEEVITQDP